MSSSEVNGKGESRKNISRCIVQTRTLQLVVTNYFCHKKDYQTRHLVTSKCTLEVEIWERVPLRYLILISLDDTVLSFCTYLVERAYLDHFKQYSSRDFRIFACIEPERKGHHFYSKECNVYIVEVSYIEWLIIFDMNFKRSLHSFAFYPHVIT